MSAAQQQLVQGVSNLTADSVQRLCLQLRSTGLICSSHQAVFATAFMALASNAPAWAPQLEEAGSLLNSVVAPFFHEITRAISTNTLPALDARVLQTSRILATAMTSIYRLLTRTTAWFDYTTGRAAAVTL